MTLTEAFKALNEGKKVSRKLRTSGVDTNDTDEWEVLEEPEGPKAPTLNEGEGGAGFTAAEALDALLMGKKVRRKTWEAGRYVTINGTGDIINQNGDYCSLTLIQCDKASTIYSSSQAEVLRSELCLKLWEEYDPETGEGEGQK